MAAFFNNSFDKTLLSVSFGLLQTEIILSARYEFITK